MFNKRSIDGTDQDSARRASLEAAKIFVTKTVPRIIVEPACVRECDMLQTRSRIYDDDEDGDIRAE